jgi:hypothetical protein
VKRCAISGSSSGRAPPDPAAGISTHDSWESGCHSTAEGLTPDSGPKFPRAVK